MNQPSSDLAGLEARQESILSRLEDLKRQVEAIKGSPTPNKVCLCHFYCKGVRKMNFINLFHLLGLIAESEVPNG